MSGPDIFLSYNREDAARAKHFADGFAAQGLDVWWDVALRSGEAYDKVTEDALKNAKAVVVLWSPRSVDSRWVRAEATLADRKKTLMPAMIEPCERPIMFELVQTAELSHWQGDSSDAAWRDFAGHVREFVGKGPVPAPAPLPGKAKAPLPSLDQLSVAVLPFSNMGKDDEQEYFADGITEDVITDLGKVSALSVIGRSTAFTFKDQLVDVQKVARQLNVTHVLEGSVRKAGNRVRVNVQLIDGTSGSQVWSERWDRDLDDIFALQDELSQAIVAALKVKLRPQEKQAISERGTDSFEAYDLFMRGRAMASTALTYEDHIAAQSLFEQAVAIDPHFTASLAGIAQNATLAITFGADRAERLKGLERHFHDISPEDMGTPGAQTLRGILMCYRYEWSAAFDALEKAATVGVEFEAEIANSFAWQLGSVGRVKDCIALLETSRRKDPLAGTLSVLLQMAYHTVGRSAESHAEFVRIKDFGGAREDAQNTEFFRLWLEGDGEATRAQFHRYLESQVVPVPEMAECNDVLEQPEAALQILRRAMENPQNQHGTRMLIVASHIAMHGEIELAAVGLRKSMLDYDFFTKMLMWQPQFRAVRQTETFKQMIRDLKIYDYWRSSGNWGDFARPVGEDDFEIIA
ncbi:TIR domain-containing protein [Altererythrobacter salegens]|uniref:TIR domain-containing protein n=1 Tax=Croceibacterium salegens TaxID=1737568 RepID=A0A6I4SVN8_9SPHN|nr:TIR domain-containing protein [Croceibacterium salegens]MXO58372.1 TIR domain-containing protein [Croceibacterium salegens]